MKAIVCTGYGPPEVLQIREVEKPRPQGNEVLVKIHATTVTPGDCRIRSFTVPPLFWLAGRLALGFTRPKTPILGMEFAGEIESVGKDVTRFKIGDQVFGSTYSVGFGSYAEYKCMPENGMLTHMPANLSYNEVAGTTFGGNTSLWFLEEANIQPGHRVLIYGASGSLGTYAVQIAHHFGAKVTGVCSSRNLDMVLDLGADKVVDYTREDFTQIGGSYDIIFDTVGKIKFKQVKNLLAHDGVYMSAVMVGIEQKWLTWTSGKKIIGGEAAEDPEKLVFLKELLEAGKIKPVIDRCYPLEQMAEAHAYVDTGRKKGNVVITVSHGNN